MTASDAWTLRSLIETCGRVEIPMIQRDYAQGRVSPRTEVIRRSFVGALHGALADGAPQLDLDFVYGSWDERRGRLEPLDGQQRLTTLFLLHWFLANLDGELEDFQGWILHGASARFTYKTRASAGEFLDALVKDPVPPDVRVERPVSRQVEDRRWFFKAWKRDPTVQSCLVMLDEIQRQFHGAAGKGLYRRLVARDAPPVVFRLLRLESFKLSDDLYIKMNARGKPLTPFEIFKAQLEHRVDEAFAGEPGPPRGGGWRRYVSGQFDTAWSNFFWHHRDRKTNEIDAAIMGFIRAVAVVAAVEDEPPEANARGLQERVHGLLAASEHTVDAYVQIGGAGPGFFRLVVRNLSSLLDTLVAAPGGDVSYLGRTDYYEEKAAFRRVCAAREAREADGLTLVGWLKFFAYAAFLLAPRERWPLSSLHDWMRLVFNLAENSDLDREEPLVRGMRALRAMLREATGPSLLQYVADGRAAGGLSRQQLREERLKAQLLLRDARWRPLIEAAETHPYFRGEIEFLFQFSGMLARWVPSASCDWTDAEDDAFRAAFTDTYTRACAIFPRDGTVRSFLRAFPHALWERALLSQGDYTLRKGSNRSFLDESDRDASWKRLLRADLGDADRAARRAVLGRVLAALDLEDVVGSLGALVANGVVGPEDPAFPGWRRLFVERPELIRYCLKRQFRPLPGDGIYLLKGERRAGEHVELHTYVLYLSVGGAPAPFDGASYEYVARDNVKPALLLRRGGYHVRVETHGGRFLLSCAGLVAFDPARTEVPRGTPVAEILQQAAALLPSLGP